jgi:hypothetical protein
VLGADSRLAVAEDDDDVAAAATDHRAQARGGRAVAQDGQARMATQHRGRLVRSDRPLECRMQRLRLVVAGDDEQELARGEQRAQPHGQRFARHAVGAAEVAGRRGDGRRVQGHAPHIVRQARPGAR